MEHADEIALLNAFRSLLENGGKRSEINRQKGAVRSILIRAGAFQTYTISPPPAIGGLIARDVDLLDYLFDAPWGMSVWDKVVDMIDDALGRIEGGALDKVVVNAAEPTEEIRVGFAFVAMAINQDDPTLDDVLDAIQEACKDRGVIAERIDQQVSNERITDRILESIRVAEFVIVDLTNARPNVFYEAGYAQGLGKTPIYIARAGTRLEFDVKDYPVIFFSSMRVLKEHLRQRLEAISSSRK